MHDSSTRKIPLLILQAGYQYQVKFSLIFLTFNVIKIIISLWFDSIYYKHCLIQTIQYNLKHVLCSIKTFKQHLPAHPLLQPQVQLLRFPSACPRLANKYILTPKEQKHSMIDTYLDSLEKEIDRTIERIDAQRISEQLDTVYFGGGTPSLLSTQQLERVLNKIGKISNINQNTEVTVEMDPGTFDRVKLKEYRNLGVNRVSMGVQTFNKGEFKKLGRGHDYKQIMIALDEIFASGFDLNQVSIDLMMGIPYQTLVTYRRNLEKALQMGFGHLSFYILTLEKGTPFHKLYNYDFSPLPHQDLKQSIITPQIYRYAFKFVQQRICTSQPTIYSLLPLSTTTKSRTMVIPIPTRDTIPCIGSAIGSIQALAVGLQISSME